VNKDTKEFFNAFIRSEDLYSSLSTRYAHGKINKDYLTNSILTGQLYRSSLEYVIPQKIEGGDGSLLFPWEKPRHISSSFPGHYIVFYPA
jgi:hypothetical protein